MVACICGCGGESRPGRTLSVVVDTSQGADYAQIAVQGLSSAELRAIRDTSLSREDWQALLRVEVDGAAALPIGGTYFAADTALTFTPRFRFDRGRAYRVTVDPSRLLPPRTDPRASTVITFPAGDTMPRTRVTNLNPGADTVPENLLRIYLHFSAPMSSTGGLEYVKLLDDRGREVKAAFLPLEADFWDRDRLRYTMFLDPGRVKQGILPNEQMGRALVAGRRYAIVVDSNWKDASGVRLAKSFRHEFHVSKAEEGIIDLRSWTIEAPKAQNRNAVIVTFPRPLDNGLLVRSLGVETSAGERVEGQVITWNDDRSWEFRPRLPWRAGEYRIVVLTILEDPQGNQIDKPFEVDMFDRVDKSGAAERKYIPFVVK
jgi:hypothetical protein